MKNLLLSLILFLTLSATAQIPKGSTKIVITNNLSAKENYDISARTLLQNDYFIESKDSDLFYIKTQQKPVNKWTGQYFLNIVCINGQIQISGMMKAGQDITLYGVTTKSEFEPIVSKGMKGSLYQLAFKEMDALATKFDGEKVYK